MSADEPQITRAEILEATQNMLQLQLYVMHTTPTGGMGPVMANLEAHLAYQQEMERTGVYVGAGPHWEDDEETWKGDGMIVLRAGNLAEHERLPRTIQCTRAARASLPSVHGWSTKVQSA